MAERDNLQAAIFLFTVVALFTPSGVTPVKALSQLDPRWLRAPGRASLHRFARPGGQTGSSGGGVLVQLYKLSKLSGVDGLTGGIFMYADLSEMI